jgi:hypothetical protein
MSSKSPGFIKWWPRCLNLSVAKALQSQRTCEAVSDACLHLLHSGLFTSPSLNRCPFRWKCPVSNCHYSELVSAQIEQFTSFSCRGFLRKLLACLCPCMDCQCSSCFLLVQSVITPLATFADIPSAGSGPLNGCEEPTVDAEIPNKQTLVRHVCAGCQVSYVSHDKQVGRKWPTMV